MGGRRARVAAALAAVLLAAGCGSAPAHEARETTDTVAGGRGGGVGVPLATPAPSPSPAAGLPGMPPLLDPADVYAADRPGALAAAVRNDLRRVYVPNHGSN